jgi:acyl-coenzyme A thioesterase PaaI-like protein
MSSFLLRNFINFYLPLLAAGIRVTHMARDFRRTDVKMVLRFYNRNAVGTQFGGSLYAMADPFYMLMLMQIMGHDYLVWDKAAAIEFVAPGKGTVYASFIIDDATMASIHEKTADGSAYFPEFNVDITDDNGAVIARVRKTLYVRKKPHLRPAAS